MDSEGVNGGQFTAKQGVLGHVYLLPSLEPKAHGMTWRLNLGLTGPRYSVSLPNAATSNKSILGFPCCPL